MTEREALDALLRAAIRAGHTLDQATVAWSYCVICGAVLTLGAAGFRDPEEGDG